MAGFDVVELLRVENILPVMGEECRNGGNDAWPVGARQRQHELMIGHGADLFAILPVESKAGGPALSPTTPLRQSHAQHQDEQTKGEPH
jgi:hypothetical protein